MHNAAQQDAPTDQNASDQGNLNLSLRPRKLRMSRVVKFSKPATEASSVTNETGEEELKLRARKLRASKFVKFGTILNTHTDLAN